MSYRGPRKNSARRVLRGEEEQESARSFRRFVAETERSGLCDDDGGLIGGASLKPDDFIAIINATNQE